VEGIDFSDHKMIRVWHDSGKGDKKFKWKFPVWVLVSKGVKERIRGIISRYSGRGWRYIVGRIRKATSILIDTAIREGIEKEAIISNIKERKGLLGDMRPNRYSSAKFRGKLRDPVTGRMVWEDICDYIKCQYDDMDGIAWMEEKGKRSNKGIVDFVVTEEMVSKAICYCKENAPGPSGFNGSFFKTFKSEVVPVLVREYNKWLLQGFVPGFWKRGYVALIPKKGDLSLVHNWRGINLLNVEWKLFSAIMRDYVESKVSLRCNKQIGFIKKRWTHENVLMLQAVAGYCLLM